MSHINANCSQIISQINNSDFGQNIFTDKIGTEKGVRERSCCFCFTRLWAFITGTSYDKNDVTAAINAAFRGVPLHSFEKGTLATFRGRLEQLELKFGKQGTLTTDLQETITKIDHHLNPSKTNPSSTRQGSSSRKARRRRTSSKQNRTPSVRQTAASVPSHAFPKVSISKTPLPSVVKTAPSLSPLEQREHNEAMLKTVSAEEGHEFGKTVQGYYDQDSEFVPIIVEWSSEVYGAIYEKYKDSMERPIDEKEIRQLFQSLMGTKITQYNLRELESAIPHLFADSTAGIDQKDTWLPGVDRKDSLGEFMSVLPFDASVIQHIDKKIQEATLAAHSKKLKKQTDREVLGLPKTGQITEDAVKRAYKKLAMLNHPDKLYHASALETDMRQETFTRIANAYQTLLEQF